MLSRSFSNPFSANCLVNTLELHGVVVEDFAIYKQGDLYVCDVWVDESPTTKPAGLAG